MWGVEWRCVELTHLWSGVYHVHDHCIWVSVHNALDHALVLCRPATQPHQRLTAATQGGLREDRTPTPNTHNMHHNNRGCTLDDGSLSLGDRSKRVPGSCLCCGTWRCPEQHCHQLQPARRDSCCTSHTTNGDRTQVNSHSNSAHPHPHSPPLQFSFFNGGLFCIPHTSR